MSLGIRRSLSETDINHIHHSGVSGVNIGFGPPRRQPVESVHLGLGGSNNPPVQNVRARIAIPARQAPIGPNQRLRVEVEDLDGGAPGVYKPYHLVNWNGINYRLTFIHKEETETKQIGYTERDWERIATQMTALWDAMKAKNAQFALQSGNFNTDTGEWKQRTAPNNPIETMRFTGQAPAADAAIFAAAHNIQGLVPQLQGSYFTFRAGNPPEEPLSQEQRRRAQHQQRTVPATTEELPEAPPPPPPKPWYKRFADKVSSFFRKNRS